MSTNHPKTQWGGLTNGLLAAGAIIGGAMLVCPGTMQSIGESIANIGTQAPPPPETPAGDSLLQSAGNAISGAWKAVGGDVAVEGLGKGASAVNNFVLSGISSLIVKAVGLVAIGMGVNHLVNGKPAHDNAAEHAQRHAEQKESFAIREDIRKMQSVMAMRMQAAGHMQGGQPARG